MRVKRFFGADSRQAMRQVRDELGDDAVILSNKNLDDGVEIVCALDYDGETTPRNVADALKKSDQGDVLQRELDDARQRILSGATFDSGNSENAFQRKARMRQLGALSEGYKADMPQQVDSFEDYSPPAVARSNSLGNDQVIQALQLEIQSLQDRKSVV